MLQKDKSYIFESGLRKTISVDWLTFVYHCCCSIYICHFLNSMLNNEFWPIKMKTFAIRERI